MEEVDSLMSLEKLLQQNKGVINYVQVYGLPRSGTNFVEWSLQNNFKNIEYHNTYARNVIASIGKDVVPLKHTWPDLERSTYALVVYKSWPEYVESYRRWASKDPSRADYDRYMAAARALDPKRCLIIDHTWAYKNYNEFIHLIAATFGLQVADKIVQPKNRLDRGGANCSQTDRKYEPSKESAG